MKMIPRTFFPTTSAYENLNNHPQSHYKQHNHRLLHQRRRWRLQQQTDAKVDTLQQESLPSRVGRSTVSDTVTTLATMLFLLTTLATTLTFVGGVESTVATASIDPPPLPLQTQPLSAAVMGATSSAPRAAAVSAGTAIGAAPILDFSPNCTAVTHVFEDRGIPLVEIPQKPSNEMVLRYCESPSVGTCCTYSMETKMAMSSRLQLEKQSKEQIMKLSSVLSSRAQKFNEVFNQLLAESKKEFHAMFKRTYGVIYEQNAYVFSDLFNELEKYYARGRVDLAEAMDGFFNTLYQKMFTVLNAQYAFDDKYLGCVSEHMKELKPFGDVPDKLSVQIKRSFVATRTYAQALTTSADVAKKMINIRLNADCTAALTKMQHCGACKGHAEKPCTNYCVNVIKGCLHYFQELDSEWDNYVSAMEKVAERLLGSFNIVMVVEPINIKISEAIMNFQESGQDISNRVFQGCGRPSLGRRKRTINPKFSESPNATRNRSSSTDAFDSLDTDILDIDAKLDNEIVLREKRAADPGGAKEVVSGTGSTARGIPLSDGQSSTRGGGGGGGSGRRNKKKQQNKKNEDNDYSGREPVLDKLIKEIRQKVKDSKKFWSNLPHQICSSEDITSSSDADNMCWNGHTVDRYMHSVTTEHGSNPEFPGNPTTTRQSSAVATQLYYLKIAINHLRNAYNGLDVDWSDQEDPYYGSGSGSGGGSDDEDDDEGSGLSGAFPPSHKPGAGGIPDNTDHPSVRVNNIDDEDDDDTTHITHTSRPKYGGGSSTGDANKSDEDDDDDDDENQQTRKKSKDSGGTKMQPMSLRRALLVYLVPLYMAWFGGIISDLL